MKPFIFRSATAIGLFSLAAAGVLRASADDAQGRLNCEITENGESASGTVSLELDGKEVASGSCGKPLSVAAGTYTAVVGLDGALDGPTQRQSVTVQAGAEARLAAAFSTGTLSVRIRQGERPAAGMAVIRKDGKQIGTLGSGVAAHLSSGVYEVTARYRSQQKVFGSVTLAPKQNVELQADFE